MKRRRRTQPANSADFFARIRRLAIIAIFSDDVLLEKLVLKGGNALDLIHKVGGRTSMDIDLSIDGDDFADLDNFRSRVFAALKSKFDSENLVLFDEKFQPKPSVRKPGQDPKWGGYEIDFKLIERPLFEEFNGDLGEVRRNAATIWSGQERVFHIDISRNEYCTPKQPAYLDDLRIYVYTLPMIAIEKLRAICQQLPDYTLRKNPARLARDFYDVHAIVTQSRLDLFSQPMLDLLEHIFAAKDVPVVLLTKIQSVREFHRPDWPAVVGSTPSLNPPDFDFYFDYVRDLAERLHAARVK